MSRRLVSQPFGPRRWIGPRDTPCAGDRASEPRVTAFGAIRAHARISGRFAVSTGGRDERAAATTRTVVRANAATSRTQERRLYPNVNTLETLSPHLATFLSQPWLCERVIKWFMHSLDVFGVGRSNLSVQIAVELLFPV